MADPHDVLAREQRLRKPAALLALLSALCTVASIALVSSVSNGFEDTQVGGFLGALERAAQPGDVGRQPAVRTAYFEYLDDHKAELWASGVLSALSVLLAGIVLYLVGSFVSARAPKSKPWQLLPLVCAALALPFALLRVGYLANAGSSFLDSDRTVVAIDEAFSNTLTQIAGYSALPALAIGLAVLVVALGAQRVGLFTRFIGAFGIGVGVATVLLSLQDPTLPEGFRAIFMLLVGALMLGYNPGGVPPAWRTGTAIPWPTAAEAREARLRERAGADADEDDDAEDADRAGARAASAGPSLEKRTPAPSPATSARKKRKRRS